MRGLPLLYLYFALCCSNQLHIAAGQDIDEGECSDDSKPDALNKWCKTSGWTANRPSRRWSFAVATYRRSPSTSSSSSEFHTARTRLLLQGGVTSTTALWDSWIYSPGINSWTPAMAPSNQGMRGGQTLTTLCETRVILFGGDSAIRNKVWLFDGTREVWLPLSVSPLLPSGRDWHSATAVWREESPCRCKESLFIYGGYTSYPNYIASRSRDLLVIENDTDDNNMTYEWSLLGNGSSSGIYWPPPLSNHLAFSIKTDIYLVDVIPNGVTTVWKLDTLKTAWSIYDNRSTAFGDSLIQPPNARAGTYLKKFGLVIIMNSTKALIYHVQAKKVAILSLNSGLLPHYDLPEDDAPTVHVVDFSKDVYVFSTKCDYCEDYLAAWTFNFSLGGVTAGNDATEYTLSLLRSPRLFPSTFDCFNIGRPPKAVGVGSSLVIWCPIAATKGPFWQLDVGLKRWTLYDPDTQVDFEFAPVAVLNSDSFLVFTGLPTVPYKMKNELWVYSVSQRLWKQVQQSKTKPTGQLYASLAPMKNGSFILYGACYTDLDVCDIFDQTEFWVLTLNLTSMTATWYRPRLHSNQKILSNVYLTFGRDDDCYYAGTYATVVNDILYVYGGAIKTNDSGMIECQDCNSNVYSVDISKKSSKWQIVKKIENDCVLFNIRVGDYAFYTLKTADGNLCDDGNTSLVVETGEDNTLIKPKVPCCTFLVTLEQKLYTVHVSYESDLMFEPVLYTFQLGCPPGTSSSDISLYSCQKCPKNTYSDTSGSKACTSCPPNLVTSFEGSSSKESCSCPLTWCSYGECILQSDFMAICKCHFGYIGDKCQIPILFIGGFGTAAAVLLVISTIYCIRKIRKQQKLASRKDDQLQRTKRQLDQAEKTVTKLSSIWSVNNVEIVWKETVGQGSYGYVWSAEYRNQTVAIKVLKISADDCTESQLREFNDESELLQSIFHGNIVQFIGTGKTTGNNPFIVLEFMERGSVRKELDTKYVDKAMPIHLQVKYALDAAKGMRHLHKQGRMHRDLKCDNLLINERGVVKVADLGCTKIVPQVMDNGLKRVGPVRGTKAVGTSLFRAPEIILGRDYDLSVDVYSYGIVLWEIQTAKHPYWEHFQLGLTVSDVLNQIVSYELRPEFASAGDKWMKELTQLCWSASPFRRPTFDDVVLRLEAICFHHQIEIK